MIGVSRGHLLRSEYALALPVVIRRAYAASETDGYAADFQWEHPSIKVTPMYADTYQDALTKAQIALKARSGPQLIHTKR